MFTFVESEAHPHLKERTEAYRRLQTCKARAAKADSLERSAAKELQDVPQEQRRVTMRPYPTEGVLSSATHDLTDPEWSGRSPKFSRRAQAYASALLEARDAYDALYQALRETQRLLKTDKQAFFQMRDADKVPQWQLEIFWHNGSCIRELIKEGLCTLSSFSYDLCLGSCDEASLLSNLDAGAEVTAFGAQWQNWFESIPDLPEAGALEARLEARLLVDVLAARDRQEGSGGGRVVRVQCESAAGESVARRLDDAGWRAYFEHSVYVGASKLEATAAPNKHAPGLPPSEPRGRRFMRGRGM